MEETPAINVPLSGAFEYGCAALFPSEAQLSTLVAAECIFWITLMTDTRPHVLLSNRHNQDHLSLNYLRLKTLSGMIWQWLLGKLKDSFNLDGVCFLYYRL